MINKNVDKCIGAYVGAAIGDAMGGPVENLHFERTRQYFPDGVQELLPYKSPYTTIELGKGYALHPEPGSITDDTYIRKDFSLYFLKSKPPYTARSLALWLAENAIFEQWWKPVVDILFQIQRGEADEKKSGMTHMQGGGIGWWSPIGILCSGEPDRAANLARSLCCIWKAPLEQDFCAAVVAGVANATEDGATCESVVATMKKYGGPLSTKLIERAASIAAGETDMWTLARKLYDRILIHEEPSRLSDGQMPPEIPGLSDCNEHYASLYWAEQVPLAVAALVFGNGAPSSISCCVNFGRDCDTTATTVGAWVGGLCGESGLPKEWVDTVYKANKNEIDIRLLGQSLAELGVSKI